MFRTLKIILTYLLTDRSILLWTVFFELLLVRISVVSEIWFY